MNLITFDESGNTGPDLLNKDQPVFCLASSEISVDEAENLLAHICSAKKQEAKFSQLRRTAGGRARVLAFLSEAQGYEQRIRTSLFHKEFMVTTKIVDLLVETVAHRDGIDLYKDGANIAMSNMIYFCMPTFCGQDLATGLYSKFIDLIRHRTPKAIEDFYNHVTHMMEHGNQQFSLSLAPIWISCQLIEEILKHNDALSLDPSIPAFYQHCAFWGDKYRDHFDVLHDQSKSLCQSKENLERFMSKDIPHAIVGHDRRKYGFPLKANGVNLGDSKDDLRLQVMDVVSGSTAYWARSKALGKDDDFSLAIQESGIESFILDAVWPQPEVDPVKLGTKGNYGVNVLDYITEQLAGRT